MANTIQQGDAVTVTKRDITPADAKSGLYYPHFAGMSGTILKVYGEEASVLVDRDSLPEAIRTRHLENEEGERKKYLDRLSEAARGSLSDKEKKFPLQYTVLVSLKDLEKMTGEQAAKRLSANDLDAAEAAFLAQRAGKKK
jgi:hypothetical protein